MAQQLILGGDTKMPLYTRDLNTNEEFIPTAEIGDKASMNQAVSNLIPLGYQQILAPATSTGLLPATSADYAYIKVQEQDVRYRDDGVNPTATVGVVIQAGQGIWYTGDLSAIQFIETTSGSEININYYKRPE